MVHPSLIEGSAKVIYEAMAAGVVPIATINSGSIIEDKKNGLIVKAGDVDDLRKKMFYLLDNYPNKGILGKYKKYDKKLFMANKMIKRYSISDTQD